MLYLYNTNMECLYFFNMTIGGSYVKKLFGHMFFYKAI
jgi:hypothetical protein